MLVPGRGRWSHVHLGAGGTRGRQAHSWWKAQPQHSACKQGRGEPFREPHRHTWTQTSDRERTVPQKDTQTLLGRMRSLLRPICQPLCLTGPKAWPPPRASQTSWNRTGTPSTLLPSGAFSTRPLSQEPPRPPSPRLLVVLYLSGHCKPSVTATPAHLRSLHLSLADCCHVLLSLSYHLWLPVTLTNHIP